MGRDVLRTRVCTGVWMVQKNKPLSSTTVYFSLFTVEVWYFVVQQ